LQGLRSGKVRIASSDAFASEFLPRLCAAFQREHSGIVFEVTVLPPEVSGAVRTGMADIGLCFSRAPEPGIAVACRVAAPVLALVASGHELAQGAAWHWPGRRATRWHCRPSTAVRQLLDAACSRQGPMLAPALESNHGKTLLNFAAQGAAVAVASEIAARDMVATGALVAVALSDRGMDLRDIEVQTLAGRTLPHAAQSFWLLQLRLPAAW
jgi:DNA-binding transcriptional LysR family regulator